MGEPDRGAGGGKSLSPLLEEFDFRPKSMEVRATNDLRFLLVAVGVEEAFGGGTSEEEEALAGGKVVLWLRISFQNSTILIGSVGCGKRGSERKGSGI